LELGSLAAVKRMLAAIDGFAALPLSAVAEEVARGDLVILASPPWAFLLYSIVRLKTPEPSSAAMRLIEGLREAEAANAEEEARLAAIMLPELGLSSPPAPPAAEPASAPARPSRRQQSGA